MAVLILDFFSNRLLYLRKVLNLKQSDIASRINVSRSLITMLEREKREPSDIIISAICNEYNVNETWLRTGEGEPFFDARTAMQKTFAAYFIEICAAFSPVFPAYGQVMQLFEDPQIMRMFNYIALRVENGGLNKRNIEALCKNFDVSFPGYEDVIMKKEIQTEQKRKEMLSTPIARSVKARDNRKETE